MNEWGKVKKVIVGTADKSKYCQDNLANRTVNYADKSLQYKFPQGEYANDIIAEANQDLENLSNIYKDFGCEVVRPTFNDNIKNFRYLYCPRDNILTIDENIIACPMSTNERKDEWKGMTKVTHDLSGQLFEDIDYVPECIQNKNLLATKNNKPMWDAANVLRAGKNILYLKSNTGNLAGAQQLQEVLGVGYKVHVLENIYAYAHLDSTLTLLKNGQALVNTTRIKHKSQLPSFMHDWDLIECPEPIPMSYAGPEPSMSQWTGINLGSLDENVKIVQATQTNLIKLLEKLGYEVSPISMKHQRTLGGGPHCCTVELEMEYNQ